MYVTSSSFEDSCILIQFEDTPNLLILSVLSLCDIVYTSLGFKALRDSILLVIMALDIRRLLVYL